MGKFYYNDINFSFNLNEDKIVEKNELVLNIVWRNYIENIELEDDYVNERNCFRVNKIISFISKLYKLI